MIVDFHAHIFPDQLAPRALEKLRHTLIGEYFPTSDGTAAGLIEKMDAWGIDVSVVCPVVTRQSQVKSVNEWLASIQSDRLVCFGGIYPHDSDYKTDIDYITSLGLKGLKFHAEYQDFVVDDKYMLKIYDYALSKGLILLHHAGFDPGFPPPFKSSPRQFANVMSAMRGGVIVAAHLGGHDQWDDVEEYLVGSGIYLDTSMGFEFFPHEQFMRIVEKHGADKILFGSDAPWSNAKTEVEALMSLDLPQEAKDAILGGNAKRILEL
ncbi:MAG: amidohydrolase family protein [Oscillospiraceae bacterium]|nr:amidohydrolase family protein [Oscillospiraceae bacterium]